MPVSDLQSYIEGSFFLYWLGVASAVYAVSVVIYQSHKFFNIHFTPAGVDYRSFGKWALVTGSTDGIGKGIAIELARLGINIILVSRNPDKLNRVAKELESGFQIETKCVTFDFTQQDEGPSTDLTSSIYDVIANAIKDLEVGILVNNVGKGAPNLTEYLKSFGDHENLSMGSTNLVNCNMTAIAKVTEMILPQMVERHKGLIINLSSMSASVLCPTFSLYSGSKKFDDTFSRALSYEYEVKGIFVQSIKPGFVATNLTLSRRKLTPGMFFPPYMDYVKHLIKTVGKERVATGYWFHHLMNAFISHMPEKVVAKANMRSRQ